MLTKNDGAHGSEEQCQGDRCCLSDAQVSAKSPHRYTLQTDNVIHTPIELVCQQLGGQGNRKVIISVYCPSKPSTEEEKMAFEGN